MLFEPKFKDRQEAGIVLSEQLTEYANRGDVIVLALPEVGFRLRSKSPKD
jgi:predicted phosphoribosyltransferase